jgi:hypothetical protein
MVDANKKTRLVEFEEAGFSVHVSLAVFIKRPQAGTNQRWVQV